MSQDTDEVERLRADVHKLREVVREFFGDAPFPLIGNQPRFRRYDVEFVRKVARIYKETARSDSTEITK